MPLVSTIATPELSDDERAALEEVEQTLARHPYLRADLGSGAPLVQTLEDVLSARLALMHTSHVPRDVEALELAEKLRTWEARLSQVVREDAGLADAWLRYETAVLLHPDPQDDESSERDPDRHERLTAAWETARSSRPRRRASRQRLRQSRDFFRHGAMLPLYWARRLRARKLVPRVVLDEPALRETFYAIEQIGPLVDDFAFEGKAGAPLSIDVALADLSFLYMQLADELLDELAAAAGGYPAAGRIVQDVYIADVRERPLRRLSLAHLVGAGIDPDAHVTKFGMTLGALFGILESLARTIDDRLERADESVVHAARLFLHHCFQTFLDEVELCREAPDGRTDKLPLRRTAWHFYRKNNLVMMLWLDLRARILGLAPHEHADAIRRWGYLLASLQIFDDLKDVALDLERQPSYPLQIAANEFPEEMNWLETRFGGLRAPLTRDEVPEVGLHACKTVRQCMQWSRLVALAHFDHTLAYAWDQRWRKSWTRRRGSFNPAAESPAERSHGPADTLIRVLFAMRTPESGSSFDDGQLAYALDAAGYDGSRRILLALFPNVRAMYRFATLQMWMTATEKARAARRLLRRSRSLALLELADGDVHHEVARDRLEPLAKPVDVQVLGRTEPGTRFEQRIS